MPANSRHVGIPVFEEKKYAGPVRVCPGPATGLELAGFEPRSSSPLRTPNNSIKKVLINSIDQRGI